MLKKGNKVRCIFETERLNNIKGTVDGESYHPSTYWIAFDNGIYESVHSDWLILENAIMDVKTWLKWIDKQSSLE